MATSAFSAISRKTVSVVYVGDGSVRDTSFCEGLANGFARKLEQEYFGGEQAVNIFRVDGKDADYTVKDSLVSLIMQTGDDIVFVFDTPEYGEVGIGATSPNAKRHAADSAYFCTATMPLKLNLYAYDSMNKKDKVFPFAGSKVVSQKVYHDGTLGYQELTDRFWENMYPEAEQVGLLAGNPFMATWKKEAYSIIYYDNYESAWGTASQAAYEYRWKDAIEAWMTLLGTKNMQKRACAEYDIALACYMLGDLDLALRWLDQSDKDCPVSLTPGLRARILSRKNQ